MVECFLAKEDVAGSTPVSRSNSLEQKSNSRPICGTLHRQFQNAAASAFAPGARYPSGKGEVCKTFMRRFDPDPRLHHFKPLFPVGQSPPLGETGSVKVNTEPLPGWLVTEILPPWASTMARHMASPMPVPPML